MNRKTKEGRKELFIHLQAMVDFINQLNTNRRAIWTDANGKYEVILGNNVLLPVIKHFNCKIIAPSRLKNVINLEMNKNLFDYVLSIGSFKEHNRAKKLANMTNKKLITVPVPLSNDSFCTNRCSNGQKPSYQCIFPNKTIIDINLLKKIDTKKNFLGIGEFLGLYTSVIDYSITRNYKIPEKLLRFILKLYNSLKTCKDSEELILKRIAISLIFKCLVMRANTDHEIGCGMDHLIAYPLSKMFQWPHGKAVYWGMVISLCLFPDWQKYGLDIEDLLKFGYDMRILSEEDKKLMVKISIPQLINIARKIRPNRKSMLYEVVKGWNSTTKWWKKIF